MEKTIFPEPKLLIGDYQSQFTDNIVKKIINNNYSCIDNQVPACRFRGTFIDTSQVKHNRLIITAWQRNAFRVRKMDASQPTIVIMTVNREGIIEDIELHNKFSGGKGLLCCWKYLNRNLKEKITGLTLDLEFIHKIKIEQVHCYHINEVMAAAYSFYHIINNDYNIWESTECFYEEDVIDCYSKEMTAYVAGQHLFQGKTLFNYTIIFHDMFKTVSFKEEGNMYIGNEVKADFYQDNELIFSDIVTQTATDQIFYKLQKFLLRCILEVRSLISNNNKVKVFNTNLIPFNAIGFLVLATGLRLFKDNYNYVMQVLTAVQRPNNIPGCIGAILDEKEATEYFPGFNYSDLI